MRGAYVPAATSISDHVFFGPSGVLTNDPCSLRRDANLAGPVLEDDVSIGANATILPSVAVGRGSFVAGGAVGADAGGRNASGHEPLQ